MELRTTGIAGVMVASTTPFTDQRGSFARLFCTRELAPAFGARSIVQANLSRTASVGAVRGMHCQHPPSAEMKLVRCLRGRVWDVALDLRAGSPTFLHWHAEELSAANANMLIIPEGCAHGFQVLEADSELLYLHSAAYDPAAEAGFAHDDPRFSIAWPLAVTDLSERDRRHPRLTSQFTGIEP